MPPLFTPRLFLLPLSRAMLERRLLQPSFTLRCETPEGALDVHFPPQWPGDPLPLFPALLAGLPPHQDELGFTFAVVTRASPRPWGSSASTRRRTTRARSRSATA